MNITSNSRPIVPDECRCTYIISRFNRRCKRIGRGDMQRCTIHEASAIEAREARQRRRIDEHNEPIIIVPARRAGAGFIDSDLTSDSDTSTVVGDWINADQRRPQLYTPRYMNPAGRAKPRPTSIVRPLSISSTGHVSCICCFDEFPKEAMFICNSTTCPHAICKDCFREYNISQLNDNRASQCCMAESTDHCGGTFDIPDIKTTFTPEQWSQFCGIQETVAVATTAGKVKNYNACPHCCRFGYIIDNPKTTHGYCPRCDNSWCLTCNSGHKGTNCYQIEDPDTISYDALLTRVSRLITLNASHKCPKCNVFAIKSGDGCNHMTCPCGTHYCYVCGANISREKLLHFGKSMGNCAMYGNDGADALNLKYTTITAELLKCNTTPRIYSMLIECFQSLLSEEIATGKVDLFKGVA